MRKHGYRPGIPLNRSLNRNLVKVLKLDLRAFRLWNGLRTEVGSSAVKVDVIRRLAGGRSRRRRCSGPSSSLLTQICILRHFLRPWCLSSALACVVGAGYSRIRISHYCNWTLRSWTSLLVVGQSLKASVEPGVHALFKSIIRLIQYF